MAWSRYLRRSRWDDERTRELEDYLVHEIDDNIARGMSPDDARQAAHRKLGNVTRIREDIYDMNTLWFLETLWQDLRYGMRILLKNPTFAIVAIMTLALGTGANAAIFQLVNAVRLRTLPVEKPHELVSIGIDTHDKGRTGRGYGGRSVHTEPLFQAIRVQQQAFSSMFAWGSARWDLAAGGERRPAQGLFVTGNFFDSLGVTAQAGRLIIEADDQKGCGAPAAMLSHGFWQAQYGGSGGAVGQTITLNQHPFTIVGVTPAGFFGVEVGRTFDVAIPFCAEPTMRPGGDTGTGQAHVWWLDIMGRLKPGWTVERAGAHLGAISPRIFGSTVPPRYNAEVAADYKANTFTATPAGTGVSNLRRDYAAQLWILLGATAVVLLITCANLANLMLARSTARDREVAVRLAIGASRGRIVRQLLSESLLIAGFGALGGMVLARWLSRTLVVFLSTANNQIFVDLTPDWRVFGFIALLAVLACVLFGLSPALKATGVSPGSSIQGGGRSGTDTHGAFAVRRGLVVVQVALSVVLIVGAMLFGRSLQNLATVDTGFRQDGIVVVNLDLRRANVPPEARRQTFDQILSAIQGVPGVRAAAEAFLVPLSGSEWNQRIVVGGVQKDGSVYFNQISGNYFAAMDTPLLAGRTFDGRDRLGAPLTAVVNETFVRQYFPNTSPIGQTFQLEATPGNPQPAYHIVGVVKDTKYGDLREDLRPIAYFPAAQEPELGPFLTVVVRTDLTPASLTPSLTRAIPQAVPGASMWYDTMTMYVRDALVTERVMASLSGFFGVLAMLIATIGLYGVMSYTVTRRKVEIGIRMALGADPGAVVRMVLAESGTLLGIGVVVGVVLAMIATRWAASLLFGLEPSDPVSFGLAVAALGLTSLFAAWVPARRASRVQPTVALRE